MKAQTQPRPVPASELSPHVAKGSWRLLLLAVAAGPAMHALVSARPFGLVAAPLIGVPTSSMAASVSSGIVAAVFAAGLTALLLLLPAVRIRPNALWLGAVAFFGAGVLTGLAHGARPTWPTAGLFVFSAVALLPPPPLAWLRGAVTNVLGCYAGGSLILAFLAPRWALDQQYEFTALPGVDSRLHGVLNHANSLGPLMVALLILEWSQPRRRPVVLAFGGLALIWSQSKTSWATLALIAGVPLLRHLYRRSHRSHRSLFPFVAVAAVIAYTIYLASGLLAGPEVERNGNSLETFTGRTTIWQVTLEVWQEDRLLGYGPTLWDDEMVWRYRHRIAFVPGHAHNQLLQTLGQSGVVGAAALICYLGLLATCARRGDPASRGATSALLGLLVLRGFTEVPFTYAPMAADFVLHLVVFWVLLAAAAESDSGRA